MGTTAYRDLRNTRSFGLDDRVKRNRSDQSEGIIMDTLASFLIGFMFGAGFIIILSGIGVITYTLPGKNEGNKKPTAK